jgi:DNA-binding beta-propeller fold protein YncE
MPLGSFRLNTLSRAIAEAVEEGWDITTATTGYDLSCLAHDATPSDLFFKPDGTKMFIIGGGGDSVRQYTLSTPWNVFTAVVDPTAFSIGSQENAPQALFFKSDGTKMYVLGTTNDRVYQYSLSTAWDVTTTSYDSVSFLVTEEATPNALFFKPDGTKMYVLGGTNDRVYQYSLSTAWNVSTASYDSVSFSITGQEGAPQALAFNGDGTKMYVMGSGNDRVFQYSLSTAWNVSTASYGSVQQFIGSLGETTPTGLAFNNDLTKMYVVGSGQDFVITYNLSTAENVSTASLSFNDSLYTGSQEGTPQDFYFKPDGTAVYVVGSGNDRVNQYTLSTPWDVNTGTYAGLFFLVSFEEGVPQAVFFKPDGTKMYVMGSAGDDVNQYTLSTPWNVSTASFDGVTFVVGSQDGNPHGLFFKPDGTKMYMLGVAPDTIYQYTLSTAWNVSTASYDTVSFSVSAQDGNAFGLAFNPDGTQFWIAGSTTDAIYQYTMTTPWNVGTASYDNKSLSVRNLDTTVTGIAFSDDGSKVYIGGSANRTIVQFDLG